MKVLINRTDNNVKFDDLPIPNHLKAKLLNSTKKKEVAEPKVQQVKNVQMNSTDDFYIEEVSCEDYATG